MSWGSLRRLWDGLLLGGFESRLASLLSALTALTLTACSMGLDVYNEVTDLRVLAIKAEPPEVFFDDYFGPFGIDPAGALANQVRFTALVVDPREGPLTYSFSVCPTESPRACADFEETVAELEDQTLVDALVDLRAVAVEGSAAPDYDEAADPETKALWPYAIDPLSVIATPELYQFHLQDNFLGTLEGSWPQVVLRLESPDEPEPVVAIKRFIINVRDPVGAATILGLAGDGLGSTISDAGFGQVQFCNDDDPEQSGCLNLRPRERNENPVIDQVLFSRNTSADAEFSPPPDVVEIEVGTSIRIQPTLVDGSEQPYQKILVDPQTFEFQVSDEVEEVSITWFASAGGFLDPLTWPKFTATLDNVYTAPAEVPQNAGGRVTIYMVAQDQRGGTDWAELNLQVVP